MRDLWTALALVLVIGLAACFLSGALIGGRV